MGKKSEVITQLENEQISYIHIEYTHETTFSLHHCWASQNHNEMLRHTLKWFK